MDKYLYPEMQPHPTDPITWASFSTLYWVIANVNRELGIEEKSRYIAQTLGHSMFFEPGVSVQAENKTDTYELAVTFTDEKTIRTITARSHVGTEKDPNHPAANERIIERRRNRTIQQAEALSETEFRLVVDAVKVRWTRRGFQKRLKPIQLHAR